MKKQLILILTIVLSNTIGAFAQNWNQIQTLATTGNTGQSSSIATVNGNPAVSFYDVSNGDLKFVRATNTTGTSWGSVVTLDATGDVGFYDHMIIVNGNPAVTYYDKSNGNLKYVRANDANGSTWANAITIQSTGDVGKYPELAIVSGNPAIGYYDASNGNLMYVRANDANGSSWGTPVTVQSSNDIGLYLSLRVVNGNPAISYFDNTNDDLVYVRATNTTGTTWGTPVTVSSTGSVGWYTAMQVVNGNPAISYFDDTNDDLKYVRANDASGSTWGTPVTPASSGQTGLFSTMEVISGRPFICYFNDDLNKCSYVRASDANGSTWGLPTIIDNTTDNGLYSNDIGIVNGNPAIAFYDDTNDDLDYVNLANTWTGGTSTDWNTASNWSFNSLPTTTEPVFIASAGNQPLANASVTVQDFTLNSSTTLTLSNSTTNFTVTGTLNNAGAISIQNATLTLGGAVSGAGTLTGGQNAKLAVTGTAGTLNFTSGSSTLETLTIGSIGSLVAATATLGTPLDIISWGSVTVNGNSVLTSNGNLTLKSTSAGTARIAAGSTSGGYISGNVTVEKYIQGGRRAFRFLAHPFSSSIALTQLTDDIDITGNGGPTNSFDYQPLNPASSFWYNPATGNGSTVNDIGWTAFTSATGVSTNSWDVCEAARILIRGSKGQGIYAGAYTPAAVTLDMSGPLNQGNKTINFTKGANTPFALVGNPFASQIDLSQTTRSATLGANFIVWNPYQGTKGGYTSSPFTTSYIFPAYGSFVVTMTGNSSITFPESCKSSSSANGLLKTTGAMPYQVNLRVEDSTNFWDRLLLVFDDSSKASFDYYDERKLYNPELSIYTYTPEDSIISIDSREYKDSQVIRMGMYVPYKKSYKFVVDGFNMPLGTKLFLNDKYLNQYMEITDGFEYWFSVTADTASTGNNRFELFTHGKPTIIDTTNNDTTKPTNIVKPVTAKNNAEINVVPNPTTSSATLQYKGIEGNEMSIVITNMVGAKVAAITIKAKQNGSIALPVENLAKGMYIVELRAGKQTMTRKLIKQ